MGTASVREKLCLKDRSNRPTGHTRNRVVAEVGIIARRCDAIGIVSAIGIITTAHVVAGMVLPAKRVAVAVRFCSLGSVGVRIVSELTIIFVRIIPHWKTSALVRDRIDLFDDKVLAGRNIEVVNDVLFAHLLTTVIGRAGIRTLGDGVF